MHINRKVEQFLRLHNYPATKFGRQVAGDPRLVSDLRQGRTPRAAMVERVESFIATYGKQQCAQDAAQ